MAVPNTIIEPLAYLSLSKYEAKVYLTLVTGGVSTAKEVSDRCRIPYGKVYEIISSLSSKGFSMTMPSKPMKYMAVSPRQAIATAKQDALDRFEKLEEGIIRHLEPCFAKGGKPEQPKSVFSIVSGRSNVIIKTEDMIKRAKTRINIQCSANSLSRLLLLKDILKAAADRGVRISIASTADKRILDDIGRLGFCSIKHTSSSRNRFISIDGRECMVIDPIPDDDNIIYGRDIGVFASNSSFTRFLDNFFMSNFKKLRQINPD